MTEPIEFEFDVLIGGPGKPINLLDKSAENIAKIPLARAEFEVELRRIIEVEKLSIKAAARRFKMPQTTVHRVCRTLKLERYADQKPWDQVSKSSQVPRCGRS